MMFSRSARTVRAMGKPLPVKAPTLLLMCGLSLASAAAADPFGAARPGPDGWLYGPPPEGYDAVLRRVPHAPVPQPRQDSAIIPLPRPRPYVPATTGVNQVEASDPTPPLPAPLPQPMTMAAETAGAVSAIQVSASGDAMSKVLTDIAKMIDLQYRTTVPLDAAVNATYSGPADTVVRRLLSDNGYGFAISRRDKVMIVTIYGRWLEGTSTQISESNPVPTPVPPEPAPTAEKERAVEQQAAIRQHPSPPRDRFPVPHR